jgi:CheY-like chemotaxis protein
MKSKPKTATAARKRILLVDDDRQILETFSSLLQKAGYDVDAAENALAAIAAVVRAAPDLILADIRMPIVGGMDLVRELKSHIDSRTIPVIAFTGYDSPEMRQAAHKAGYDGFLAKPKDPVPFLEEIGKLLRLIQPQCPTIPGSVTAASAGAAGKRNNGRAS